MENVEYRKRYIEARNVLCADSGISDWFKDSVNQLTGFDPLVAYEEAKLLMHLQADRLRALGIKVNVEVVLA